MRQFSSFIEFLNENRLFEATAAAKVSFKRILSNVQKDIQRDFIDIKSKNENSFVIFYQPETVMYKTPKVDEFGDPDESGKTLECTPFIVSEYWDMTDFYPSKKAFYNNPFDSAVAKVFTDELTVFNHRSAKFLSNIKGKRSLGVYINKPDEDLLKSLEQNLSTKLNVLSRDEAIKVLNGVISSAEKTSWLSKESDDEKLEKDLGLILKAAQKIDRTSSQSGTSITMNVISVFKSTYVGKEEKKTEVIIDVPAKSIFAQGFGTTNFNDAKDVPGILSKLAKDIKDDQEKMFKQAEDQRSKDSLSHDAYR